MNDEYYNRFREMILDNGPVDRSTDKYIAAKWLIMRLDYLYVDYEGAELNDHKGAYSILERSLAGTESAMMESIFNLLGVKKEQQICADLQRPHHNPDEVCGLSVEEMSYWFNEDPISAAMPTDLTGLTIDERVDFLCLFGDGSFRSYYISETPTDVAIGYQLCVPDAVVVQ